MGYANTKALNYETIDECASKLWVYDVYQEAWEQERNGFEANASHVLTHLSKDLWNKDFMDQELIRTAIAPDSVQYGLRLVRWAGVHPSELLIDGRLDYIESSVGDKGLQLAVHHAAVMEAASRLATHLHDLGHESSRERAVADRTPAMIGAGALLVASAEYSAEENGFDLVETFDARLSALRERFGIPEPPSN